MKRLLIAGIDPGTTLGYALLDLQGKIVKLESSKQMEISSLVREMIKEGKVAVIGTDKGKAPKLIEKTASMIGAKLIKPKEDLRVEEKRELTKDYEFGNEHEKDALASAVYAFKRIRKLLTKIDVYLKKHNKEGIADEVKEIMLKDKGYRIAEAVMMIEKPEIEEEKKIKRKRTGKTEEEEHYAEEEKTEELDGSKRKLEFLKQKMNNIVRTKLKKVVRIKNQKIDMLTRKIREQQKEIARLNYGLEKLKEIAKKTDKNIVLKKIRSLSFEEVEKEEMGRTIYVEEPNIFSEKSVGKVKGTVEIIISKKEMSSKVKEKFQVSYIEANKVDAEEFDGIILINKEKLEKEKSKIDILKKVIEEYRESRT